MALEWGNARVCAAPVLTTVGLSNPEAGTGTVRV